MFTGAVPKPMVEQIMRIVPFDQWGKIFVGCSGSFRVDGAIKRVHPRTAVYSNDVSLLSCALGALLTGKSFDLEFTDRLAFIEAHMDGCFETRVAALMVALEMATYKSEKNEFARGHFRHFTHRFEEFLQGAATKLKAFTDHTDIDGFYPGDFRQQAERAATKGGGIAAFPPTYKGGYERLYRFVDDNTRWSPPEYGMWNPDDLGPWIQEVHAAGIPYCILTDHELEGFKPAMMFQAGRQRPVYTYANVEQSSIQRTHHRSIPFRYTPVDPSKITRGSHVTVVPTTTHHLNFLKDEYLAPGITHAPGDLNFCVFIDGKLVGAFILTRSKWGDISSLYLLCDFSIARERRLSKLVAMLATCSEVVRLAEVKYLIQVRELFTTAFTHRPVSMKYRGIFRLHSRKPGMLNYASEVRNGSPQEIYREWFDRYARNTDRRGSAS